jgi:hypothetical protein
MCLKQFHHVLIRKVNIKYICYFVTISMHENVHMILIKITKIDNCQVTSN